jgi:hypothetical protein
MKLNQFIWFYLINKMLKNKRGDIPVIVLVIGVVALCTLAIVSFYIYKGGVGKDFEVVEVIEQIKLQKEKIAFYKNTGMGMEEIREILEIEEDFLYIKTDSISVRYNLP